MKTGKRTRHDNVPGAAGGSQRVKNKGFTYVEVIIVLAILAVALVVVFTSINSIHALNVKQCVKDIAGELAKEKIAAMTRKSDVYMRLYKTGSGIYADEYENSTLVSAGVFLGKSSVGITWFSETNTAGTKLGSDGIVIAFNKSNGSFKSIGDAWALYSGAAAPAYADEYYTQLVVANPYGSKSLVLWPQTGKFSYSG
jgi:prepilin-type N-terminal cleavage/methylation domain-containing protein